MFSVVTSLGNKPAETKHNGNIYKRIVKTNTGVHSFFAGLYKAFWATKSQIRQIGACWCQFFQKHLTTIVLVNYHFLWSTPNTSVQQPRQPKINGRLKIQEIYIYIYIYHQFIYHCVAMIRAMIRLSWVGTALVPWNLKMSKFQWRNFMFQIIYSLSNVEFSGCMVIGKRNYPPPTMRG